MLPFDDAGLEINLIRMVFQKIHAKHAVKRWRSTFEIDDRVECVFADTDNIRLPVNGIVCGSCGLVQGFNRKSCLYCGLEINTAVH